jgi:hypothetical protein
LTGTGDSMCNIIDRGRIGKAGHDDGRLACQLADVVGDCDTGEGKLDRRTASISKPITRHSRSMRLRAIAPPMMPSPTIPTVLSMRVLFYRIRLTGNAGRALISDQAMSNRQVASAGQAALFAMRQKRREAPCLSRLIGRIPKQHGGRDSEDYQNGGCRSEAKH